MSLGKFLVDFARGDRPTAELTEAQTLQLMAPLARELREVIDRIRSTAPNPPHTVGQKDESK